MRKMRVESYIKNEIEKKPIFRFMNIILFIGHLIIPVILGKIIIFLITSGEIPLENLKKFTPINLVSPQVSISFLSITIMQLILPNRKEKILGVTYQNLLFKWKVFKHFNVLDCTMYMFLLMAINISLSIADVVIIDETIKMICKAIFVLILFESFLLAIYMIYLGLISKFKISRIYYLLFKRMCHGNSDVYNMLLKGMRKNISESEDKGNESKDYIKAEIAMLEYMSIHIDDFELFTYKDTAKKIINEEKRQINSFKIIARKNISYIIRCKQ